MSDGTQRCTIVTLFWVLALAFSSLEAARPVRILVLGDSLTAGLGLPQAQSFPAQMQQALSAMGHNVVLINGGVSGDTTAGGLARLGWALADNPDAVIVALGANDGLRAIDPALTRHNLEQILEQLQRRQLPVLLLGMTAPPNLGLEYGQQYNSIYLYLATRYQVLLYPFFLEGVAAVEALNQADGIHPNAKGVKVLVERILPYVLQLLEILKP